MPYVAPGELFEIYTSGTTATIPSGFYTVEIWAIGAGGSGRLNGAGGGSGAMAYKSFSVLPGEWGTNLTIAVGLGSASNDGGNTTVSGTLNGSAITTLSGGGGKKPTGPLGRTGGLGGTASGGSTNTDGNAGQDYDTGNSTVGLGGSSAANSILQIAPTWGAGGDGDPSSTLPGFDGIIIFQWTR